MPSDVRPSVNPSPHADSVKNGLKQTVFGGKGFGAAENDTVDDNQGYEYAQLRVEFRQICGHQQVNHGYK